MTISLTGFMGCGKSSVGRKLSELLCCRFADLDAVIEQRAGKSIPEIFNACGEAGFRRMEKEALESVLSEEGQSVLALGGGAVTTPECETLIHGRTLCVYLRTSAEELTARLTDEAAGRPMLQTPDSLQARIIELMSQRSAIYERTAHLIIDTDNKSIGTIAKEIAASI